MMKPSSRGVKQARVQRACKHLTLSSHWNALHIASTAAVQVCARVCVCLSVHVSMTRGWEETQQLHHDCNIWAISERFMIYLCILSAAMLEMFLLANRDMYRSGECGMVGKGKIWKIQNRITLVSVSGSWRDNENSVVLRECTSELIVHERLVCKNRSITISPHF